jgi:mandelate racemase
MTVKPLVHLIEEIGRELTDGPSPLRPDGNDGRKIPPARLAGPRRHGGIRPRHGLLGRARPDRGSAGGEALGGSARPIKAYDSYGVVDPTADERALRRSLEQGFRGIKIKGGDGDAANDERVVKGVRALLGPTLR